ncbi:MAG: pyridoxal-phosphate dependent enzyme, partial [Acetobacteraceae bacterium]|nr:pyridoxal-phosphate dependent enzyme [Acetobacteraceae bacterium]
RGLSLGEGDTPLVRSRAVSEVELLWKDESRNPTGSHKDRALAVAVTHALLGGARRSLVVSAGSTGLSNAAYAARAGLESISLMSRGAPEDRLSPLATYGSRLIEIDAGIDDIIAAARSLSGRHGIRVASTTRSSDPYQAEGGKTIAYELAEQLGGAPDWVVVPVGGGGTIAAIWRGWQDLRAAGRVRTLPRLAAVVPAAYPALQHAFAQGVSTQQAFETLPFADDVPTILNKLSHAHPPDGIEALEAIRNSNGTVVAVSDEDAIAGTLAIARRDGLYLEPSSGVVLPALERLLEAGVIAPSARVVALACGSGFRETFVMKHAQPLSRERASLAGLDALFADRAEQEATHPSLPA